MDKSFSENRRVIRPLFTALLITVSATAGYYWGAYTSSNFVHQSDYLIAGFAVVLCAILASTALDFIHSRIDDRFEMQLAELERLNETKRTEDSAIENMQQALDDLTNENRRLIEKLSQMTHPLH